MFMSGCLGTNSHVLFSIRALNSSVMAWFQTGEFKASVGERGKGSKGADVCRLNGCLGFKEPVMVRVRMGCVGGGGGLGTDEVGAAVGCAGASGGCWVSVWAVCWGPTGLFRRV